MTAEEVVDLAKRLAAWALAIARNPDTFPEGPPWPEGTTKQEESAVLALTRYQLHVLSYKEIRRKRIGSQLRAQHLLRSLLSPAQRSTLHQSGVFIVQGSAGGVYRLCPRVAFIEQVERHGTRWFAMKSFCFHDPDKVMPPADVTLGQMLHILTDEPAFLATAIVSHQERLLWNGDYLRRMRQASRERAARV
jgi:hypothetical protein